MPSSFEQLKKVVLEKSCSKNWIAAVSEWGIVDADEDESCSSSCVCGKEKIRYLYTIKNLKTRETLSPIGSSCIRKFERSDLNNQTSLTEQLFKLYHAVEENEFLSLSTDLFSRKLLKHLYDEGAFYSTDEKYHEEENYKFLLKMFNKRDKDAITQRQKNKIAAILLNNIKPFVQKKLESKVRHSLDETREK